MGRIIRVAAAAALVGLFASTADAASFFQYARQSGDLLGLGLPPSGTISDADTSFSGGVVTADHEVSVILGDGWAFYFAPPPGTSTPLAAGTYENASGLGIAGHPGFTIQPPGGGCRGTGRFVVLDIQYGPGNTLTSLAVDFQSSCLPPWSFYGGLRFNSSIAYVPPPIPAVPTQIAFVPNTSPMSMPFGSTVAVPAVKVLDANAQPVAATPVHFLATCGTFATGGTTADALTDSNGVASAPNYVGNGAGHCDVVASMTASPYDIIVSVEYIAYRPSDVQFNVSSATPPTLVLAGHPFTLDAYVSAFYQPLPGIAVSFTPTVSSGGATAASVHVNGLTDAGGHVTADLVAGSVAGTYIVNASAGDAVLPITVDQRAGTSKIWTGNGATNKWSDPGNWQDGAIPVSGDSVMTLSWPDNGRTDSYNDLGPLRLDSMSLQGSRPWAIQGDPITLTSATPVNGYFPGSLPVTFAASSPTLNVLGSQTLIAGPLTFSGGVVTINAPDSQFEIDGPINETAPTSFVIHSRRLFLDAFQNPGNFSGTLDYTGGEWFYAFYNTMGSSSSPTIIRGNAQVDIVVPNTGGQVAESFDFRNGADSHIAFQTADTAAPVDVLGAITLNGSHTFFPGNETHLKGVVSGSGRLILDPEAFTYPPLPPFSLENGSNSFSGGVEVRAYTTVRAAVQGAIPAASELVIASSGTADIEAGQAIKSLACSGTLAITLPASLRVAQTSDVRACTLKLNVPAGYNADGMPIVLVTNSSGSGAGNFAGLPEGAAVSVAGSPYSITYHGGSGNDIELTQAASFTLPSVQDMWWGGPPENGWGMSLIQHNDTLFGALYIYDASGKPTWVVMPGGSWDASHSVYTGAIYQPVGTPFYAYNSQSLNVGSSVGSVTITFQDANNAILDYAINGVSGRKFLSREMFASGSATRPDRSDLWWGGSAQNGWGITLLQQADTLFAVWYTYDANGIPTWYVMPGGAWTANDTYEGTLYRTTSSPWAGRTYDAYKLSVMNAGTFKFQFNGDAATFTYNADGHGGTIPLVKEPF